MKNGGGLFDLEDKRKRVKKLEEAAGKPDFWNNSEDAPVVMQEIGRLKERLGAYDRLAGLFEECDVLLQLYEEVNSEEDAPELLQEAENLGKEIDAMLQKEELGMLFKGRYPDNNAIIALHPGAGGLEAQDWAEMLLRMYTRWSEKKGYTLEM